MKIQISDNTGNKQFKEYHYDSIAKLYFEHDEGSDTGDIQFLNGYIMGWWKGLHPDISSAINYKNTKGPGITTQQDPHVCSMNTDESEENAVVYFIYDKKYECFIAIMISELNEIWKKHFSGILRFEPNIKS